MNRGSERSAESPFTGVEGGAGADRNAHPGKPNVRAILPSFGLAGDHFFRGPPLKSTDRDCLGSLSKREAERENTFFQITAVWHSEKCLELASPRLVFQFVQRILRR